MEERIRQLEEENARLRDVLAQIREHTAEIDRLLNTLSGDGDDSAARVTDSDVKNLLKKYSRL